MIALCRIWFSLNYNLLIFLELPSYGQLRYAQQACIVYKLTIILKVPREGDDSEESSSLVGFGSVGDNCIARGAISPERNSY